MLRSNIHGLDAGLAKDTIRHHRGNPYWYVEFRVASVIIPSSTCTSLTVFEEVKNLTTDQTTVLICFSLYLSLTSPY